ncbi:MAG: hypothetical protein Q8K92_19955 [Leadbetterella sp.]|nr:hypothetical protein [Leadbetterella sp.]
MITLDQVEADLKNYKLTHEAVLIKKANSIGFNGVPGKNIPVLPLASFVSLDSTDGRVVMASSNGGDPIQLGQTGTFNPKNFGTLKTKSYMSEPAKADEKFVDFEVQALYNTYLQRVKQGKFNPEEVPFISEMLDLKFEKIEHYIRRAMCLASKNHAAANGGSSTTIFDGWLKQIADDIALTSGQQVVEVAIDALTSVNALAQMELMFAAIPTEDFLKEPMVAIMSLASFKAYKACYEDKYKYVLRPDENGIVALHDTNNIIINVEAAWSELPMITPIGNLHGAVDFDLLSKVDAYYDKPERTLKLMQDFKIGAGIANLEKIYFGV